MIYSLWPNADPRHHNPRTHRIVDPTPGRGSAVLALLRPSHGIEGEWGHRWVVRDAMGYVYGGETPEDALADFDMRRPRGITRDLRRPSVQAAIREGR